MKKFLVFLLLVCLLMGFTSCNPEPAKGNPGSSGSDPGDTGPTSRSATDDDAVLVLQTSIIVGMFDYRHVLDDPSLIVSGTGVLNAPDSYNFSLTANDLVLVDDLNPYMVFLNGLHINGTFIATGSDAVQQISIDLSLSSPILGSHTIKSTSSGPSMCAPDFSEIIIDGTPVTGFKEVYIRVAFGDINRSFDVYKWEYEESGDVYDAWLLYDDETPDYHVCLFNRNGEYSMYDSPAGALVGPNCGSEEFPLAYKDKAEMDLGDDYLYVSNGSSDVFKVSLSNSGLAGYTLYDRDYLAIGIDDGYVFLIDGKCYFRKFGDDDLRPLTDVGRGTVVTNPDAYYGYDGAQYFIRRPELKLTYSDQTVFFEAASGSTLYYSGF